MLNQQIQSAFTLYKQGELEEAEAACRRMIAQAPGVSDVWRLYAMIVSAAGRQDDARTALLHSLELTPNHVEAVNLLGIVAGRADRRDEAEMAYRKALTLDPDYAPARRNLASVLIGSERCQEALKLMDGVPGADFDRLRGEALHRLQQPEDALAAFTVAAAAAPDNPRNKAGQAAALIELGRFDDAIRHLNGLSGGDVGVLLAKAHLAAMRLHEAVTILERVLHQDGSRTDALFLMAQCLWMDARGDEIAGWFERALQARPNDRAVVRLYARTIKQTGDPGAAIAVLDRFAMSDGVNLSERADSLIEAGRADEAYRVAQAAIKAEPEAPFPHAGFTRAALMTGRAQEALESARKMRALHPRDQFWIAVECEALRRLDPDQFNRLCDPFTVAAPYDLPTPGGFSDIQTFNNELARRVRKLHAFKCHPLDQSLRGGVQTSIDLLRTEDPVIDAFFKAAQTVVDVHISAMPDDHNHPFFAYRAQGGEIASAWSVLLRGGGRHVSHVHPEGWISSAYYVETPGDLEASPEREGWLVLGEPPFAVPGSEPTREIAARPGRLVLFPSYLWHGTRPICGGERLSIAFDVRPRRGRA